MKKTRKDRLAIFFDHLTAAALVASADEALALVCATLDNVENEFSGDPNEPERWKELDRMFPPQSDSVLPNNPRPGVTKATTRGHDILIGSNGSFEIWRRGRTGDEKASILELAKPGADGKGLP